MPKRLLAAAAVVVVVAAIALTGPGWLSAKTEKPDPHDPANASLASDRRWLASIQRDTPWPLAAPRPSPDGFHIMGWGSGGSVGGEDLVVTIDYLRDRDDVFLQQSRFVAAAEPPTVDVELIQIDGAQWQWSEADRKLYRVMPNGVWVAILSKGVALDVLRPFAAGVTRAG